MSFISELVFHAGTLENQMDYTNPRSTNMGSILNHLDNFAVFSHLDNV